MAKREHKPVEVEAFLACASLLLFGAALFVVMFNKLPAENEKYIMLLLGSLIGVVKDTFARYFNVTKGASEQRDTIATLARATEATAVTAQVAQAAGPLPGTATATPAADVAVTIKPEEHDLAIPPINPQPQPPSGGASGLGPSGQGGNQPNNP